ncbi:hypothetical protein PSHT_06849 [Puccinia striiformis]|uniref:Retrovirus-related Pol polyprotein from transposon TNT 1-94-like beta-barrel domain-containing protein n=1 Tax=Puccinia striiformis TaxID=27350 RepID=A0A2S4W349_9BASI|nr:hypothetical protein PSHT_06849 [Puccinia striiformis]
MVLPPPWNPSPGGELAAGGSNWQLGNNLTRERLAEDIAILQANLDNLPPSPEAADRQRTARPNQEIADAKLAKEIRDFDKAQFQLKQQKLVQSAIALGKSLIRSFAILQPDGTNFAKWFGNLAQISRTVMANPKFFHYPCLNSTYEKIGRAIILASIHDSLVAEIQTIDTCFMMYARLMMKLKTTSRALQMNTCYKFRAFNINPTGHNSGIALDLCDFHTKWAVINVKLTMDAFRGFILQVAVMDSGAPYQEAFELPIENLVQSNESRGCPPLDNIMKALDICKEQHHNTMVVTSLNSGFTSLLPPSALSTSIPDDDIFDPSAYLADIDQGTAWTNRELEQQLKRPSPPLPASRTRPKFSRLLLTSILSIHQPSRPAVHFSDSSSFQTGGVLAHKVEINLALDDLDNLEFHSMVLGEDIVSSVAVFDTGALHGITGSKFLLHDFRLLPKPIGVSVATNGAGSTITGVGSLKFRAPDGHVIVLQQVLYCEQAKTTLISMAALRKANAFVAYNNKTDTFKISCSNGKALFECVFEPSKNLWCMPYPMIRSDITPITPTSGCSVLLSEVLTTSSATIGSTTNKRQANVLALSEVTTAVNLLTKLSMIFLRLEE